MKKYQRAKIDVFYFVK